MEKYKNRYNDPSKAIDSQFSSKTQKQLKDNHNAIKSLFKVVLLCGKQGIPLCGHRDDGIDWSNKETHDNQGNFIELANSELKLIINECTQECYLHIKNHSRAIDIYHW